MHKLTPAEIRRMQSGIYVPCKKCGKPQSSKHEFCMKCRKQACIECKQEKVSGNFVGRLCKLCAKKRGLS